MGNDREGDKERDKEKDTERDKVKAVKKTLFERDVNFVENVNGKPGEGFYITLDIGTPPQVTMVTDDSSQGITGDRGDRSTGNRAKAFTSLSISERHHR